MIFFPLLYTGAIFTTAMKVSVVHCIGILYTAVVCIPSLLVAYNSLFCTTPKNRKGYYYTKECVKIV